MHNHKHTHTHGTEEMRKKTLHRIKIIQGHLKAVEKMIEENKYCIDIIHQSMAIQKSLKRLDMVLMEDHLKTCVVDQIKDGEENLSIEELLKLYEMK